MAAPSGADSLIHVREVHDELGDLAFVVTVATHSRTALEKMSEVFNTPLRWIPDDAYKGD